MPMLSLSVRTHLDGKRHLADHVAGVAARAFDQNVVVVELFQ
jgi:hypothetical protein